MNTVFPALAFVARHLLFVLFCLLLLAALLSPLATAQRGPVPGLNTSTPYLIYYGDWTHAQVEFARDNYRFVILHPSSSNITPVQIATMQAGPDLISGTSDDISVFAYISVGEDDRPGSPFAGDGSGPRVDPRTAGTEPLAGIDPLGDPSSRGTGFASYYLDDNDLDGQPDRNAIFGGYYVNPGDPVWFTILVAMTKAADGRAGFEELLTTTTGNGYHCDGLFLDTLDTPAPNSFGATQFEWTTPAYQALVARISTAYPAKLMLGNRGVFFYNPNLKSYQFTLRPHLDMVLFESYHIDSSGSGAPTAFFDDNKFNFAPKINAEAQRADGFTVLSLGYTGPGEPASLGEGDFFESQAEQGWPLYRTNPALNTTPFSTAAADWNAVFLPDTEPPIWDSTAAHTGDSDPGTPGNQPPVPRVGIQQAVGGDGQVTVRWDVARDQTGPVRYHIYHTDQPVLDFDTATKITKVTPDIPALYLVGTGAGRFAFEHTISGLNNGTTYRFAVGAEDALANEDSNTVVLAATPSTPPPPASEFRPIAIDGAFADWTGAPVLDSDPAEGIDPDFADLSVANDADFLYIRFTLHNAFAPFIDFSSHVFIDTDNNAGTGFAVGGTTIGSDFMVESWGAGAANGWDERLGNFNDGSVSGVSWNISPTTAGTEFELRISRNATYDSDSAPVFSGDTIRIVLQDNRGDITAPAGILYTFAAAPPPRSNFAFIDIDAHAADWAAIPVTATDPVGDGIQDIVSLKVANDDAFLYVLIEYNGSTDTNTFKGSPSVFLSLDNDADTATGFDIYGLGVIGAEVSWQNDFAFVQDAGNYNLGATFSDGTPGIAPYFGNTRFQEYRIRRDATFSVGGGAAQPVFPENTIRLAAWTDRATTAEFTGTPTYVFASNPGATGYEVWRLANFTPAELADPLASGPQADLEPDGVENLLEFALGLDPRSPDPAGLPSSSIITVGPDDYLAITYTRRPPADGLTYSLESSPDLATWDDSPAQFVEGPATPQPGGLARVTVRLATPIPAGPNFLRLRVKLNVNVNP